MKVVVLAGGTSTERDVSLVTGTGVAKALKRKGHQIILLDAFYGCPDYMAKEAFADEFDIDAMLEYIKKRSSDFEKDVSAARSFFGENVISLCQEADKVFIALHGANGEDGRVQAAFDLLGVKYTGTDYLSSALAMDKERTKDMFHLFGIPTPGGRVALKGSVDNAADTVFPAVVKPCCGGSSVGVSIINNESELQDALTEAFRFEDRVIIEEYIKGREFSVAIIDGKPYPVIEIDPVSGFYDYKNKYTAGAAVETCPADIPEAKANEMMDIAAEAAAVLGIDKYCRLDFMMNENGDIYCLEVNTLPGLTPTSLIPQEAAAVGLGYDDLCDLILKL